MADLGQVRDCCRARRRSAGVKSGVCLPITDDGKVIGTMDFFTTETLDLSQERTDALRNVGGLVSTRAARDEGGRKGRGGRRDAQAVTQVLEKVGGARTEDEAARVVVDTVREAFGWAYGSFWRLDPKENGA